MTDGKSCVIIGAGIAGLTAARMLSDRGWSVVLLDKGRGPGGRMATRRMGEGRFDHGAQFFTVRDARFREAVDRWESRGWVTPWFTESGHVRYRGADGMEGIAKQLAQRLEVHPKTKVERIATSDGGWRVLADTGEEFRASALLLTAPAPQSKELLAWCWDALPAAMVKVLNGISYDPCFALLARLDGPSGVPAPGYVRLEDGPITFIADNTQKGISTGSAAVTIHARADFTRRYFDAAQDEVAQLLRQAAQPWLGTAVLERGLHRWKYSQPVDTTVERYLFATEPAPLAIAGDGFGGARVEGAFLSGLSAAERMLTI